MHRVEMYSGQRFELVATREARRRYSLRNCHKGAMSHDVMHVCSGLSVTGISSTR